MNTESTTENTGGRQTQVPEQCNELDCNMEKLLVKARALEECLKSVLRPPLDEKKAMDEPDLVPLASFLRGMNMRVIGIIDKLQAIEARLEL